MTDTLRGSGETRLVIGSTPTFELSPYLFMQFMEPLGTTDSSVEAAWDHQRDCWRQDVIDVTRELRPPLIRWGGCLSSYYRWKEGVGPREKRVPYHNLLWGGIESSQVGTAEFVDFCHQVGADPLLAVNFESDGRQHWAHPGKGMERSAGPEEAAEWVDYCNNPDSVLRRKHGHPEPFRVSLWQIGNETSYDPRGYDVETAARRTLAFAKAMRRADPAIRLIGWGDGDPKTYQNPFAPRMIEIAGEELNYIAFHHMWNPCAVDPDFEPRHDRADPERTWDLLMRAYQPHEAKIRYMRDLVSGSGLPLALTECHFAIPGKHRNELLSSWAAGVSYARVLNAQARHGDILKIATAADFCGTRWTCNAIMIPTPVGKGRAYMQPVASVMALYRKHTGERALDVLSVPAGLDATASRTGDTIFLHVVNTSRVRDVEVQLQVEGLPISSGRVFQIAADPQEEVDEFAPDVFAPTESTIAPDGHWTFPAASVTCVELTVGSPLE